jgi:toxin CcdB
MTQFSVYRNKNPSTKATFPYLLDVQADLLEDLQTRVVIPLTKTAALARWPLKILTPIIVVDGEEYVAMTPQLAGIAKGELGPRVTIIPEYREALIAAMDLLITGV